MNRFAEKPMVRFARRAHEAFIGVGAAAGSIYTAQEAGKTLMDHFYGYGAVIAVPGAAMIYGVIGGAAGGAAAALFPITAYVAYLKRDELRREYKLRHK